VAEVHVATWQRAYRGLIPDDYLNSLSVDDRESTWREILEKKACELWVAAEDNSHELAGWVAFGKCRDADQSASVGELWAIYVAPNYWSSGVGRTLWLAARTRLIERGFTEVTLWCLAGNERADRFYRNAGFLSTSTKNKFELGGAILEEVRYHARLAPSTPGAGETPATAGSDSSRSQAASRAPGPLTSPRHQ